MQLEYRMKNLEDAMIHVRQDVAVIRSNYVSREDMHKELHALTWEILLSFGLIGSGICAVTFVIAGLTR